MNWILSLRDVNLADVERVGGKAAHLGAMLQAGFPVPEGFVITVDAFVEHFGLATEPLVRPAPPQLSTELMAEVVDAMLTHLGEESSVAVRSSSSDEDDDLASFAGQHSTYYFVPPSQIDQAIVDCWMSLWSKAALSYRRANTLAMDMAQPVRMAVIVQKMVPATRSGVTFSKDPLGQTQHTVLEACWGLGAALVDGHVNPDQAIFNEEGELISYNVRDKRAQVRASASNIDGGRLQPLAQDLRHRQVLTQQEAEHLANLALQLETLFEAPQDVEWSYVGDTLHVLQSRSITTLPLAYPGTRRLVLFKPLAENFTEPLSPMAVDLFADALPKIGEFHNGRLYVDIDIVRPLLPFELSDAQLAELLLLRPVSSPLQWSATATAKALGLGVLLFLADGANWFRAARLKPEDLAKYAAICHRIANDRRKSLKRRFREMVWASHSFKPAYAQMFMANVSSGRYFVFIAILEGLIKRWAPEYPISELPKIYHGRGDMRSMQMLNDMSELRKLLHSDQELHALVLSDPRDLPVGHEFTVAFDRFLQTYGHRGAKEIDIAAPRWRESPADLMRLLAAGERPAPLDYTHGEFLAARDELSAYLKPWQRWIALRLADTISRFITLRENTRHYHVMAFDRIRQQLVDVERELIMAGQIHTPGDIFFLQAAELEVLQSQGGDGSETQHLIRSRRRQWQLACKQQVPETLNVETVKPEPSSGLHGACASAGVVEGVVRVIHRHSQGYELKPGEILVAPVTDPAWTPMFAIAAGVIVANGSFLSHAGTVARELHLPCLVDVKGCTEKLRTGQRVRLDATAGVVELL